MTIDSSLWTYFINASIVVKCVMLLLGTASVMSWTFILQRGFYLKDVRNAIAAFEQKFWSGGDLAHFYSDSMRNNRDQAQGVEVIFQAGFKEFLRWHKQPGVTGEMVMENVTRAMHVAETREQDKLELHLTWLATVGSIAPYVGLFGTVWGLMLSLRGMAGLQQATISAVAPGIAEALIATAMGLFAAIPAVIAYNRYATDITRIMNRFDSFKEEFSNILFRQTQMGASKSDMSRVSAEIVE